MQSARLAVRNKHIACQRLASVPQRRQRIGCSKSKSCTVGRGRCCIAMQRTPRPDLIPAPSIDPKWLRNHVFILSSLFLFLSAFSTKYCSAHGGCILAAMQKGRNTECTPGQHKEHDTYNKNMGKHHACSEHRRYNHAPITSNKQ